MILVFLHGPPAAGKHTVGRALADLTGFELYHNHLVVDDVLRQHAFGSPGFVAARDQAWRSHLEAAARATPTRHLIFTFNPENSVPQAFIDWLFTALPALSTQVHSIGLTVGEAALEARLATADRRQFRKLTDLALYRRLRAEGAFATPVIPRTDLVINTESTLPATAAACINDRFKLA